MVSSLTKIWKTMNTGSNFWNPNMACN